jgi:hypothetical protein
LDGVFANHGEDEKFNQLIKRGQLVGSDVDLIPHTLHVHEKRSVS